MVNYRNQLKDGDMYPLGDGEIDLESFKRDSGLIRCLFSSCNHEIETASELVFHLESYHHTPIVNGLNTVAQINWNRAHRRVPVVLKYRGASFAVTVDDTTQDVFVWITQIEEQPSTSTSIMDYRIQIRLQAPVIYNDTRTFSQTWEGRPWSIAEVGAGSPSDAFIIRKACILNNFSVLMEPPSKDMMPSSTSSIIVNITAMEMSRYTCLPQSIVVNELHQDVADSLSLSDTGRSFTSTLSPFTSPVPWTEEWEHFESKSATASAVLPEIQDVPEGTNVSEISLPAEIEDKDKDENDYVVPSDCHSSRSDEDNSDELQFKETDSTDATLPQNVDAKKEDKKRVRFKFDDAAQARFVLMKERCSIPSPKYLTKREEVPEMLKLHNVVVSSPVGKLGTRLEIDPKNLHDLKKSDRNSIVDDNQKYGVSKYYVSGYPAIAVPTHERSILDMESAWTDGLLAELQYYDPGEPLQDLNEEVLIRKQSLGFRSSTYKQTWQLEPDMNLMN